MADIYSLIDRGGTVFRVLQFSPRSGRRRAVSILILPGANCEAKRYRWLAEPLAAEGATVFVLDPPQLDHPSPTNPTVKKPASYVTIDQMIKALAMPWSDESGEGMTFVIGHSLGGSILLEYLDPAQAMSNPRSGVGAGYAPPIEIQGGVVIGATLQADVMGTILPWRQNDTALTKPAKLPILFFSGEFDGIASPEKVSATVARYQPPTAMVVQAGANHFGWTDGQGVLDLRTLDGKASLNPDVQKEGTLRLIASFFSAITDDRPDGIANALREVAAPGDEVTVR